MALAPPGWLAGREVQAVGFLPSLWLLGCDTDVSHPFMPLSARPGSWTLSVRSEYGHVGITVGRLMLVHTPVTQCT